MELPASGWVTKSKYDPYASYGIYQQKLYGNNQNLEKKSFCETKG